MGGCPSVESCALPVWPYPKSMMRKFGSETICEDENRLVPSDNGMTDLYIERVVALSIKVTFAKPVRLLS